MTHNIDPLVLPPHTLHVLQPLVVGIFKELKKELSTEAEQRWANMPAGTAISKRNFIAEACMKSMKPSAVEKGWEGAGIQGQGGTLSRPAAAPSSRTYIPIYTITCESSPPPVAHQFPQIAPP